MKRDFQPCVYLLASHRNGTIYCGVTSDLVTRVWQHHEGVMKGFTKEHSIPRLVWFEAHDTMEYAIEHENRIKKWNCSCKVRLIEEANPDWPDLSVGLGFPSAPSHRVVAAEMDPRLRGGDEGVGVSS